MNRPVRVQRLQNFRIGNNATRAQYSQQQEPDKHDWGEQFAHHAGPVLLDSKQQRQNDNRYRDHPGFEIRGYDFQTFNRRHYRDRRGNHHFTIEEAAADQAKNNQNRRHSRGRIAARQRHQRQDPPFTGVICPHHEGEIFNAYHEIKSIRDKDEFLIPFIDTLCDPFFKTGTVENDQKLLKSLIVFACIMEGLFFYVGFVQLLAMGRQNKMTGSAEQYQYILRDEAAHCSFGVDVINTIKMENPNLWTQDFQDEIKEIFNKAIALEYQYAIDTMPNGIMGLNSELFMQYIHFIADRRRVQIGLPQESEGIENPFPWMSEILDLNKEKNFFDKRVTEYKTGSGLEWD